MTFCNHATDMKDPVHACKKSMNACEDVYKNACKNDNMNTCMNE